MLQIVANLPIPLHDVLLPSEVEELLAIAEREGKPLEDVVLRALRSHLAANRLDAVQMEFLARPNVAASRPKSSR